MEILKKKIREELYEFDGRIGLAIEIEEAGNFYIDSEEVFRSASLIKLPILLAGIGRQKIGELDLEQLIPISKENRAGGSGILYALSDQLSLTVKDLMTLMIIVSDNTATNILIDLFEHTMLNRKMMDLAAIEKGIDNFTNPREMIHSLKLLNEINDVIGITGPLIAYHALRHQQFRDKLPAMVNLEKITVVNKTGELPSVEHDCAIFEYQGRKGYVAVLTDSVIDQNAAKQIIRNIGKHISDFFIRTHKDLLE
jgi:beta-lactamase class A